MRSYRPILIAALLLGAAVWATGSFAGERADWGVVKYIGADSDGPILLIENDRGLHTLIVDPYGDIRTAAGTQATLSTINPDDHVDFAVSTWAGMSIVDLVYVTPGPQGKLARSR
jgi:hypothetical protein